MRKDNRTSGIIRVSKSTDRYAVLDKYFLDEDDRLSFRAKGLLAYLLAKPDDWRVYVGDLVRRTSDGRTAIYSTLKDLERAGYVERDQVRNGQGKIRDTTIPFTTGRRLLKTSHVAAN
jgi:DNA-binding MarR family transcriptional regulator